MSGFITQLERTLDHVIQPRILTSLLMSNVKVMDSFQLWNHAVELKCLFHVRGMFTDTILY